MKIVYNLWKRVCMDITDLIHVHRIIYSISHESSESVGWNVNLIFLLRLTQLRPLFCVSPHTFHLLFFPFSPAPFLPLFVTQPLGAALFLEALFYSPSWLPLNLSSQRRPIYGLTTRRCHDSRQRLLDRAWMLPQQLSWEQRKEDRTGKFEERRRLPSAEGEEAEMRI